MLKTESCTPQWEPCGLKTVFSGVVSDLENFTSNLSCLPALAWRKLSGCVSSGVYSASQTNELRSWAGFQACKRQKNNNTQEPSNNFTEPSADYSTAEATLPTSRTRGGRKNSTQMSPQLTVGLTVLSSVALGKTIWID